MRPLILYKRVTSSRRSSILMRLLYPAVAWSPNPVRDEGACSGGSRSRRSSLRPGPTPRAARSAARSDCSSLRCSGAGPRSAPASYSPRRCRSGHCVLAGITAALTAVCYAELASTIPVSGSSYSYTTMGEIVAFGVIAPRIRGPYHLRSPRLANVSLAGRLRGRTPRRRAVAHTGPGGAGEDAGHAAGQRRG